MSRSDFRPDSPPPPVYDEADPLFQPLVWPSMPEPSAPPAEPIKIRPISYDLIVEWWNNLSDSQRMNLRQGVSDVMTPKHLAQIRKDYAGYYPKEYFLKKPYLPGEISASDYYLMFHFCDEMVGKYDWFGHKLMAACEKLPPPYAPADNPPSYEEATQWWEDQSEQQQAQIRQRANHLNPSYVRNQYRPYYRCYDRHDDWSVPLDFYDFYLLSRYPRFVYYPFFEDYLAFQAASYTIELAIRGTYAAVKGVGYLAQGLGNFLADTGAKALSGGSSKRSDSDTKFGDAIIGLLIIAAVVAAAASAVIGALYSGAKSLASFANIAQGKKIIRSLWRLACAAGAAFGGVKAGLILGAMAGSAIPGIGTAAGAIIGAVFGSTICAAIGAAIGKYSLQLVAYLRHKNNPDVISATNPDKWDVKKVENNLKENGVVIGTLKIREMLVQLREQKNSIRAKSTMNSLKSHVVGTEANKEKDRYNNLLEAIKEGQDPCARIRVDKQVCFMWSDRNSCFIEQQAPLPELKGGLKL
jgi:hypothetical protein